MPEGEPRYRELTENIPHLVWATDHLGVNQYQSPSWFRYVGTDSAASAGKRWLDFYHPDDRDHMVGEWRKCLAAEGQHAYDVEARIRRHDGQYRWFRIQGSPVRDATGKIVKWAGTCTDIDENKRSREVMERLLRTEEVRAPDASGESQPMPRPSERPARDRHSRWIDLVWVLGGVGVGMGMRALLTPILGGRSEFVLAFAAVAVVAALRGVVPGLITAILCVAWAILPWPEPTFIGREGATLSGMFLVSAAFVAVLSGSQGFLLRNTDEKDALPISTRSKALLIATGVFPVLFCIYIGWATYQDAISSAYARLQRTAAIATEHLNRVIETNQLIARTLLLEVGEMAPGALRDEEPRLHSYMHGLVQGLDQIHSIWLWDDAGRPVASSFVHPPPAALKISDREYFRAHRDDGLEWFVSGLLVSRVTGETFFSVSRRLDVGGTFTGVVSASLRPAYFSRFYDRLGQSEPGLMIGLLRSDGAIIARWPQTHGAVDSLLREGGLTTHMRAGSAQGALRSVDGDDGRVRHVVYARAGSHPLYIATAFDRDAIFGGWYRDMMLLAMIVLPASCGLVWLLYIAFERSERMRAAYARAREEAAQRTRAEDALRHSQKLEALGLLTGGVAHDFNNLLAVVSNSVYLLKHVQTRRGAGADESSPVAAIARAVESGTKLTRQLLAFSRRQPLAPEVVRVQDVLLAVRELLQTIVSRQVELDISLADDLPCVKLDPAELELAVINLVVNARDALRERGRIAVNVDVWEGPNEAQRYVRIAVGDNGIGIPAELIERVFDPFFTTKPRGSGTGLGLSQVYGLCTQAGGTVRIDSQVGVGTTVSMYLPITAEAPPEAIDDQAEPARISARVLLVEDNADIGATMQEVLRSLGAEVTYARSGDEAMKLFTDAALAFDVIVSDVVMPGRVSGIELAKHVRRHWPQIPVVLMTGYTAELQTAVSDGFTVLSKPVDPDTLARVLARGLPAGGIEK